jgi:hypothetical protein
MSRISTAVSHYFDVSVGRTAIREQFLLSSSKLYLKLSSYTTENIASPLKTAMI